MIAPVRRPCICGCGNLAKAGRNYVLNHKPKTIESRMWMKIVVTDSGCWEWQGAHTALGYGTVNIGAGKYRSTHRAMYEIKVGPIPEGMHLDHLCRNTRCCNPQHLEPVTPTENKMRGASPNILLHLAGVCARGHSLDVHAYRRGSTGRVVQCRACLRSTAVRKGARVVGACVECGLPVVSTRADTKYCSHPCKEAARFRQARTKRHQARGAA